MGTSKAQIFYSTRAVSRKLEILDSLEKVNFFKGFCYFKFNQKIILGPANNNYQEVSRVFGTKPYLPHEFMLKNLFSTKVDVFSFGVVLFELATGYKAYDKTKKNPFLYDQMAKINEELMESIQKVIDMSTPNDQACFNLCQLLIRLGKKCCDHNPNYRPDMESALIALEKFNPEINLNGIPWEI